MSGLESSGGDQIEILEAAEAASRAEAAISAAMEARVLANRANADAKVKRDRSNKLQGGRYAY